MSWLKVAAARIRAVVGRRPLEEDLHDELCAHLEMLIEEHVQRGMPPAEARYAALWAFGGVEQVK
jgi:hypothetical protein